MFPEGGETGEEEEKKGCSCWRGRMQDQPEKDGIGKKKLPCGKERKREREREVLFGLEMQVI